MNPSYVQTFNRHRLLFSLPVVILTVLALWVVASTPKEYKAGASLYIDNPVTQESSFFDPNPSEVTPAAQAQQLLTELLATKSFQLKVGRKGPLTEYLETHPSQGWGPAGLLRKLRGSGSAAGPDREGARREARRDDGPRRTDSRDRVPRAHAGGHGGHGERARGDIERGAEQHRHRAPAAGNDALQESGRHVQSPDRHDDARLNGGSVSSAEAQVLTQARNAAETRLRRGIRGYNQAALNLAAAKVAGPHYEVRDKPTLPAPAVGGMKKSVFGVVAGIFVGLLISFLAIVLITSSEDKESDDGEREDCAR